MAEEAADNGMRAVGQPVAPKEKRKPKKSTRRRMTAPRETQAKQLRRDAIGKRRAVETAGNAVSLTQTVTERRRCRKGVSQGDAIKVTVSVSAGEGEIARTRGAAYDTPARNARRRQRCEELDASSSLPAGPVNHRRKPPGLGFRMQPLACIIARGSTDTVTQAS